MTEQADLLSRAYERAKEHVGKTQRVRIGVVTQREVARFAYTVGDPAPECVDVAAARAAGYADVAAPPLYLSAVLGWEAGPAESELMADGNATDPLGAVPLDGLRLMGGGQSLTFHEPLVVGMDVTMEVAVDDVVLKAGGSGRLLLLTVLRRYLADEGVHLLDCRETFIAR